VTEQDENKAVVEAKVEETKPQEAKPAQEPAKEKPPAKKPVHKPRAKSAAQTAVIVLIIILVLIGVAGFYAYDFYKQQTSHLDLLATQLQQLQADNTQLKSQLSDSLQTLSKQQADLTNDIEMLRARNTHLRKDWLISEAEYLLQLANYRLLFERDIKTAIVALNTADQRLRETGDPGLINVRKVIAESVQALKDVPQSDLAGLSLTMSAITQDINKLPLNTPDPLSKLHEQQQQMSETRKVKTWSELPAAVWHDLKSLIIIRDHTQPVEPLLAPDQRFFLTENLRLQIEQARLAMLSGHADVYKERLATAIGWIEKYFDKEAPQTQATLTTLKQLQASAIAPPLPDISKPYQLLEDYRQNQAAAASK
jgi:uroporphyrin-3 C-methyltransferase